MNFKKNLAISVLSLTGLVGLNVGISHQVNASTNEGSNPISRVATSGFDKKQVLEVRDGNSSNYTPFFYNGIQIRADKLRDDPTYGFDTDQVAQTFKQAKSDGYTVINTQLLWSDVQPDETLKADKMAYVKSDQPDSDINESNTTINLGNSDDQKSLLYLDFDLNQLQTSALKSGNFDGSKLRIYAKGQSASKITVYGLKKGTNWSRNLKYQDAPFKGGESEAASKVTVSPTWDSVKDENYYDLDVSSFVKNADQGKISLVLQSDSTSSLEIGGGKSFVSDSALKGKDMPSLTVSSKNNYDFSYVDQLIDAARKADIKLEILWFGADTTSTSTERRMPWYALSDYAKAEKANHEPMLSKSGPTSYTGEYNFLMDKNDTGLQQQEGTVINQLFNHISSNNSQNGYSNTVIGAQVANEPMVSKLHGSSQGVEYPQSEPSIKARQAHQDLSDADFRSWTMWHYTDNLAKQVKDSQYPVLTRVNNAIPSDADLLGWNEKMRSTGTTNLDAVGADTYNYDYTKMYNFGHDTSEGVNNGYAKGDNLPMVMEDGAKLQEKSFYTFDDEAPRAITNLAGGATHNYYDFMSGDGYALYKFQDGKLVANTNASGTKSQPLDELRSTNQMLNKMGHDLATKQADGAGGKQLLFFNAVPADGDNFSGMKSLNGTDITYHTDTNKSMGVAVQRDQDDIILGSTRDSDATFTLKNFGKVTDVSYGQYESPQSDKWITTDGTVTYKKNDDGTYTITVPKYSVVNVSKKATTPTNNNGGNNTGTSTSTPSDSNGAWKPTSPSTSNGSTGLPNYAAKEGAVVYATQGIYLYKSANFSKGQRLAKFPKVKRTSRPTFVVTDYARSSNGHLRYKVRSLKNGKVGYITASRKYVVNAYYQTTPKSKKVVVIAKKGVNAYRTVGLKGKVKHYRNGTHLNVKRLIKHGLTARYQLTNGHHVTAKKTMVIQK